MQTLISVPGLSIEHDAAARRLMAIWQGHQNAREKKMHCQLMLDQLRQTRSTTLLNDSSHDLDGWETIVRWIASYYYQAMADAGLLAVALVLPQNLRARTDVDEVLALVAHPSHPATSQITIDTFTDVEAASFWLQNLKL